MILKYVENIKINKEQKRPLHAAHHVDAVALVKQRLLFYEMMGFIDCMIKFKVNSEIEFNI